MRMSCEEVADLDRNGQVFRVRSSDTEDCMNSQLLDLTIQSDDNCKGSKSISSRLKTIEYEIESLLSEAKSDSRHSFSRPMYRMESGGSIATSFNSIYRGRSRDSSSTRDLKVASRTVSNTSTKLSENKAPRVPSNCRSLSGMSQGDNGTIQSYLHSINNNVIKTSRVISRMTGTSNIHDNRCSSAPTSDFAHMERIRNSREYRIEIEKRLLAEKSLETLKADLKKCQQEEKKLKNIKGKMASLTEELNCEKQKRETVEKNMDALKEQYQQLQQEGEKNKNLNEKYLKLVKELEGEREKRMGCEKLVKSLNDRLDESSLKIQELIGARTMAVELAHNLGEQSRSCLKKYKDCMSCCENLEAERTKANELLKNLNEKLETMTNELSEKDRKLMHLKEKLESNEKIIKEFNNRDVTDIPQVKSLLEKQQKAFKSALMKRETNEMALQAKCSTYEVEMNLMRNDFAKRLNEIENMKQRMNEELERLIGEKDKEISMEKHAREELTEVVKQCKERITELSEANKHQEIVIKCQNDTINSKDDRLGLAVQEAELNARLVEQQKSELRQEHSRTMAQLEQRLQEERDKLRIKEKVADDQADTIMQLKSSMLERSKELHRRSNEMAKLEKQLLCERQEKENIACDVAHLKMLREKNSITIKDLQKQIETLKDSSLHKKHTFMLEELEKKVQQKQAEWQLEITKITEERNQARETAQYAIDNLATALQEHQNELMGQKNMRHKMASLIRKKEEQLSAAEARVNEFRRTNGDKSQSSDNENLRVKPSWSANRLFKQRGVYVNSKLHRARPSYKYKLI
ncbi:leucine-rich repeat and coiled-coil domain-containing protein 1 [Nilaparvata lugens]|uniref:leucine-rich repeat and coiled-coil domain-containing protein 1 n=1 Tax=Nilaparvata lugens TaxID=108931 RepID=UPI00193E2C56|nr:leucine-rich repeat and coiled-coil domain-containing protein 1 [Nilaparvata lugens]